jgi:hypothetical protein
MSLGVITSERDIKLDGISLGPNARSDDALADCAAAIGVFCGAGVLFTDGASSTTEGRGPAFGFWPPSGAFAFDEIRPVSVIMG